MNRILAIGQVEDRTNIDQQILNQTLQPDRTILLVDDNPAQGIDERRQRIVQNHKKLQDIVKAYPEYDLIWQVEGDCIYSPDTLQLLVDHYEQLKGPQFGYISGVQIGRHGIYALGAWHFNEDRTSFNSVDHTQSGIVEVDASGFYCLLAERSVWLKGKCTWDGERWGPDVNFGLSLKDQGHKIYVDRDIPVGHKMTRQTITGEIKDYELWPDQPSTCNVTFIKEGEKWKYKTS